jgi:hypothetical protein
MLKSQVSASTATGDTVKTLIDTVTLIAGAKKIVGFAVSILGGLGMTTLENVTGIVELESSDFPNFMPQQYILDQVSLTGTGMAALSPKVWPMNIPCKGQERIAIYVTMDVTLAINPRARAQFIIDDGT